MRLFLTVSGILFVILGSLGIFLPLLPTTPFFLLATACFLRSSPTLYKWLTGHRYFGLTIRLYLKYRGMTGTAKTGTLISLWGCLFVSAYLLSVSWVRFILMAVGVGVTIHILTLNTVSPDSMKREKSEEISKEE